MKKKIIIIVSVLIVLGALSPLVIKKINEYNLTKQINQAYDEYENEDYLNAYNHFVALSNQEMKDKSATKLVESVLYGKYDYEALDTINFDRLKDEIYKTVCDYLAYLVKPTVNQTEVPLKILKRCGKNSENDVIYKSLNMIEEIDNLFVKEPVNNISSKDYNLGNHPLNITGYQRLRSINGEDGSYASIGNVASGYYISSNEYHNEEYYCLIYGDFSDIYWLHSSDGNWFYGIRNDELIRMNADGEIQIIDKYSHPVDIDRCKNDLYDGNLLFLIMKDDDKTVVYRYYPSESLKSQIVFNTKIEDVLSILYPNSNNVYIRYYNPAFLELFEKAKEDKDFLYEIFLNYRSESDAKYLAYECPELFEYVTYENTDIYRYFVDKYNGSLYIEETVSFK